MNYYQKVKEKKNKGSSTLEVMIALAIMVVSFGAIISLYYTTDRIMQNARDDNEMNAKVEALLEAARVQARINFNGLVSTTTADAVYRKSQVVNIVDDMTKDVTVRVEKITNTTAYQELSSRFIDWRHALGTKTCTFVGDWKQPTIFGGVDLGIGNVATDIVVVGNYAYITANSATRSKSDFFVIDVSNPSAARIVAQLNTGPGLMTLAVAGDYAYVGNSSINAQLQIINIHDPYNPVLVSSYKLPGIYNDGTTIANSIYYSKGKVYLGTKKSIIAELHIIDVTNPNQPVELGSWEANTAINAIGIKGTLLYDASPDSEELKVLETRDPLHIVQVGGFDAPGSSGNGKSIFSVGTTTYLGRTIDGGEFFILDTSTTSPLKLGSYSVGSSVNDLVAGDGLAFLATTDTTKSIQILSVVNPNSIVSFSNISLPAKALAIDCRKNVLYIALNSNDALRIIIPQ